MVSKDWKVERLKNIFIKKNMYYIHEVQKAPIFVLAVKPPKITEYP